MVSQCRLVGGGLVLIVLVAFVLVLPELLIDDASNDLALGQVVGIYTMDRAVTPILFLVFLLEVLAC